MKSKTTDTTSWYNFCIKQAIRQLSKGNRNGWIFWWAERNRFKWNLSSEEISCYRRFKKNEYVRLRADLLACVNGKPRHVLIQLKCKG